VVGTEGNTSISREAGINPKVNLTECTIGRANNHREGGVSWHGVFFFFFFFLKKRKSTIYYAGLNRSPQAPMPGWCTQYICKRNLRSFVHRLPILDLVHILMLLPQLLTSRWQRCGSVIAWNLNACPSSSLWHASPLQVVEVLGQQLPCPKPKQSVRKARPSQSGAASKGIVGQLHCVSPRS
jgi:hypothetical protein